MFEEEQTGDYMFAQGKQLGHIKGKDADFWVIPDYWFQDNDTGEFVNMHTGVVVNRKCYLATCGVVREYAIEPERMLCGEMTKDIGGIQICIEAYTHPKDPSKWKHTHRAKSGYSWGGDTDEENPKQ